MVKIVKKMYYYIHTLNKKVIAHCHVGMGRTGIARKIFRNIETIFVKKIKKILLYLK